jgi:hypothetical protein
MAWFVPCLQGHADFGKPLTFMRSAKQICKRAWERFGSPRVSDEKLEQCVREVCRELPVPVFWLLGKTHSGSN